MKHVTAFLLAGLLSIGMLATNAFAKELKGFVRNSPVLPARDYAEALFQFGAQSITAFEKIYPHVLENSQAVVEWTRGTFLLPYLDRLSLDSQTAFLKRYRDCIQDIFPQSPVVYGFKRVLLYASKP